MPFFTELRRRNVVRVGVAYAVIGWVLAQIAEFAFENFGAPEWVLKTFVTLLLLGLPIALLFAWAFELTPEGIKREKDVDRSRSTTGATGRKLDFVIIVALVVALSYFLWERQADVSMPAVSAAADESGSSAGEDKASNQRSIAVLPFVNMSSDDEQDWFSDGLTEEILNALARTPDLLVAARTSSFKFKGSNEDVPTIAKALGVAHVLEGSVRSGPDRLRVTAQLIRASDGFHLWSQSYDRKPDDVIQIQEDIAIEIATALETAMVPEALARMVTSGTNSVPAYNAYLEGLSIDFSTLTTGDAYQLLRARDAFNRAVDLDPEFSSAYWELANFWEVQSRAANIAAGTVEVPYEVMRAEFEDAIVKAIRFERNPINRMKFEVLRKAENLQIAEALRLNTEYLRQRPNDKDAQSQQLILLARLGKIDELRKAIEDYEARDGYDVVVTQYSITFSMLTGDKTFARRYTLDALRRHPDHAFVQYQAHRTFLYAGDIDGATSLVAAVSSSDLPEDSRILLRMRQACAENNRTEAERLFDYLKVNYAEDVSMMWIGNKLIGRDDDAQQVLMPLDEQEDIERLIEFVSYHYFDPRPYPNLMERIKAQGVEPRDPLEMPYRCKT